MGRSRRSLKIQSNSANKPAPGRLFSLLNGLNAGGFLADIQQQPPANILIFGPKDIKGDTWAGMVLWYRLPGVYNYKIIHLLGVWAVDGIESTTIIIGKSELPFIAAHYTAESYFKHIQHTFEIHYGKVSALPDDRIYEAAYKPENRLKLRDEIEKILKTISLGQS